MLGEDYIRNTFVLLNGENSIGGASRYTSTPKIEHYKIQWLGLQKYFKLYSSPWHDFHFIY